MKPLILGAVLATTLLLAPVAHADTGFVPIGDPATDTLQLWSEIAASIEWIAQDAASAAGQITSAAQHLASTALAPHSPNTSRSHAPQQVTSAIAASPAVAVETFPPSSTSAESQQPSSTAPASAPSRSPPGIDHSTFVYQLPQTPAFDASAFVTQASLSAQLQQLSNVLSVKDGAPSTYTVPQNVAAGGNSDYPYAAENAIDNLSNVTITNANLTASEIPALGYLPLAGGTLTGTLNVPTLSASSTNYGVLTATSASTTAFSNFGTAYFGGTATSSFDSAGDLTVAGVLTTASTTATSTFAGNLSVGGTLNFNGTLLQNGLPFAGSQWTTNRSNIYFAAGNVGIGTTSPAAPFELFGSNSSTNLVSGGGIFEAITNADQTAGNFDSLSYREVNSAGAEVTGTRVSGVFNSHVAGAESADLAFLTRNAGVLSEKLRITGVGNVGIGTSSPLTKLTVQGTAGPNDLLNIASSTGASLLYLNAAGDLGIGTTTPSTTLSIQGALSVADGSASSVGTLGTERTTDGAFTTDPSSAWTLGSGWSWDSVNSRASYSAGTGAISAGNTQSGINQPSTAASVTIDTGGTGYVVGDTVTISGGGGNATYTVSTVKNGVVTGLTQVSGGTGYTSATGVATTGGTGTGLVVSINQIADAAPLTQTITTNSSDPTTSYVSRLNGATVSGVTYNVTFTIQNYSGSGSVKADIGSVAANMYPYPTYYYRSNGTYTILLTSNSSTLTFTPTADFAGAITNVSVKPVTPTSAVTTVKNTDGSTAFEMRSGGIGNYNTFIGTGAGQNNTTVPITGSGFYSISNNESRNTAVGYQALYSDTIGGTNTANGAYALFANTTGVSNTASGFEALYSNTIGFDNVGFGIASLWANTIGNNNVAVGSAALHFNTASNNVAVGGAALYTNTTGSQNTALGGTALDFNTTGSNNVAVGYTTSQINTTGSNNTSVGEAALTKNSTGSNNTALGTGALGANIITSNNTALGFNAMASASTSQNSVAVGYKAGRGASTNNNYQGLTALGYQAGLALQNGSDFNTFLGYQAGTDVTTGADNILLGAEVNGGGSHLTTGYNNILIGYNAMGTSTSSTNFLNIGGVLFGTLPATSSATSFSVSAAGKIGVGTSSPYSRLEVWGTDTASTSAFAVVNSASTTVFSVFDSGNSTYSGSIFQSSDRRLKTDVQTLEASSSLSFIDQLNPVSYLRLDQPETGQNLGFIAQQVQQVFPQLVSTTSPTSLTPDGTLTLNYEGLIAPIVAAIQELSGELASLAHSITTQVITAVTGNFQQVNANELCVGSTCVTPAQFQAMVAAANVSRSSGQGGGGSSAGPSTPDTPPVIQINGDNPAIVQVGDTYNDLGATITGPQADLNLGIQTYLNGTLTSNIVIDTSQVATDTVDYVVTDQSGLTSTSTRTVLVEPAAAPSIVPGDSASSTAATTTSS